MKPRTEQAIRNLLEAFGWACIGWAVAVLAALFLIALTT